MVGDDDEIRGLQVQEGGRGLMWCICLPVPRQWRDLYEEEREKDEEEERQRGGEEDSDYDEDEEHDSEVYWQRRASR